MLSSSTRKPLSIDGKTTKTARPTTDHSGEIKTPPECPRINDYIPGNGIHWVTLYNG